MFLSKQHMFSSNSYVLEELVADHIRNCELSLCFIVSDVLFILLNSINENKYSNLVEGGYDWLSS